MINKCVNGIPFLGFLIKRNTISILSKNWNRKLKKVAQLDKNYSEENEFDTYNRYSSMFACLVKGINAIKKRPAKCACLRRGLAGMLLGI